jgi:nitrate reductase delta subunit
MRETLGLFAEILEYPDERLAETVARLEAAVGQEHPEAAALLAEFRGFADLAPLGRRQEIYTSTFDLDTLSDLNATLYPYVGHHLFGESYKRSVFMTELSSRMRAHGHVVERELPDHLVVLLRFLAVCPDEELAGEIVHDAMVPALVRMAGEDEADEANPLEAGSGREAYRRLLKALRIVLEAFPHTVVEPEPVGSGAPVQ